MPRSRPSTASPAPRQTVLVLQGGGALGAYQLGVIEALLERGIEPNWVIGTSIGAINAALVAGNTPAQRLARLRAFWARVEQPDGDFAAWVDAALTRRWHDTTTVAQGIPGFFRPRPEAWWWPQARVGVEQAAYYSTDPLRATLGELLDPALLAAPAIRLTMGAVAVASARMQYFDSRDTAGGLAIDHVLASGALPPAFPAVRIGDVAYWDGGLCSNTPIEAVFDDRPRRNSLIFAVNVWHAEGPEPTSVDQVLAREKDIQYASRHDSHIARQKQIHHLRRVIRELSAHLGSRAVESPAVRELASWGGGTTMHVAHLEAPVLPGEGASKDIDFSASGIRARRAAGRRDALQMLEAAPWEEPADPLAGVVEHRLPGRHPSAPGH